MSPLLNVLKIVDDLQNNVVLISRDQILIEKSSAKQRRKNAHLHVHIHVHVHVHVHVDYMYVHVD